MATKKKSKKKSASSKKTATRKASPALKKVRVVARKKSAKKTAASSKTAAAKKKKTLKQTLSAKSPDFGAGENPKRSQRGASPAFSRETVNPRSGAQSGDMQGLSDVESADSESVDELIEEGNSFEAGVVSGVEDAGERGTREVRTREVAEDDVPEEYLDKD
jgi:hypothetical protein